MRTNREVGMQPHGCADLACMRVCGAALIASQFANSIDPGPLMT
jgi:hypothetical protein